MEEVHRARAQGLHARVEGERVIALESPGALPQRRVMWIWFGALPRGEAPKGWVAMGGGVGPSQGRTGESGAFGMWPHPRGSSRIFLGRPASS